MLLSFSRVQVTSDPKSSSVSRSVTDVLGLFAVNSQVHASLVITWSWLPFGALQETVMDMVPHEPIGMAGRDTFTVCSGCNEPVHSYT